MDAPVALEALLAAEVAGDIVLKTGRALEGTRCLLATVGATACKSHDEYIYVFFS